VVGVVGGSALAYDHRVVEPKWQKVWAEKETFRTPVKPDTTRPKFYALDMFPYPSGSGLHVGHPEGYTATDITSRYKKMQGFNVLHPMGWDAFGLPAEQYALQTGTHPRETTAKNIDRFRTQLQSLGFGYDWKREVATTDKTYYKWTQWIFKRLFEKNLAYQDELPVNWCPKLGTVLANEEVIDGLSERGGFPVERRPMRQWVLRITQYAERLLDDLDLLDWPQSIKDMQRNWIGKSEGAQLAFTADNADASQIPVFTTRPETVAGVSYLVLAPEYADLAKLVTPEHKAAVDDYCAAAARKSDRDRGAAAAKSGVFTGAFARNPVTAENVPIWVADYVLAGYGTGAVMAVPAHDVRDFEFATAFDLPIRVVVAADPAADAAAPDAAAMEGAFTGEGVIVGWNGAAGIDLDGMPMGDARAKLLDHLEAEGLAERRVNYKLRDWLFSRQRYWGEPFPVIFVDGVPRCVPDAALPVELPEVESYQPSGTGDSPLATVPEWVNTVDPETGRPAVRETNTMPQWAGSCWYYLRFVDPQNDLAPIDPELEKYWLPVDLYVGGVEHAVLHLLYARFWHKVLYDCGVVTTKEPFQRLVNQGIILGEVEHTGFRLESEDGEWISAADVDVSSQTRKSDGASVVPVRVELTAVEKTKGDVNVLVENPAIAVSSRAHKMSKSRGNVVNPDSVIDEYGADALRLYLMFMGPLEQVKPWSTKAVSGMARLLSRTYRLAVDPASGELSSAVVDGEGSKEQLRALHVAIKKITEDTEGMRYNTAIAAMTEFVNAATKWETRPRAVLAEFVRMLSPYAPHLAEELWEVLGGEGVLAEGSWPQLDERFLVDDQKTIVIQVNGKVRHKVLVDAAAEKDVIMSMVMEEDVIRKFIDGKTIRKQIYVPDKLVNLVVS